MPDGNLIWLDKGKRVYIRGFSVVRYTISRNTGIRDNSLYDYTEQHKFRFTPLSRLELIPYTNCFIERTWGDVLAIWRECHRRDAGYLKIFLNWWIKVDKYVVVEQRIDYSLCPK